MFSCGHTQLCDFEQIASHSEPQSSFLLLANGIKNEKVSGTGKVSGSAFFLTPGDEETKDRRGVRQFA